MHVGPRHRPPAYAERLAVIEAELPTPLVAEGLAPLPPRAEAHDVPGPPEAGYL